MNICVIGTGYVGLITGCGFANLGHDVVCVDIDQKKVDMVNEGDPPIFENGLKELLNEIKGKRLSATSDLKKAVASSEIIFICVGTPSKEDGSIDLSFIEKAFIDSLTFTDSYKTIVIKSTVVPGTTEYLAKLAQEKIGKKAGTNYGICMNPEFLREGNALEDFFNPDRIVIGADDEKTQDEIVKIYSSFSCPILKTDSRTAEMIKYTSNSLLATKVSFANEIGNLCKKLRIDVYEVMDAVGMDKRISRSFLNAGIGFGGSCFPKDVKALASLFSKEGIEPKVINAVLETNDEQPGMIVEIAKNKFDLSGKKVSVLGLAFKPDSDDMREAPSIKIVNGLLKEGASVILYDSKAMDNAKTIFTETVMYADSLKAALDFSDIVFILTEWDEFKDEKLYVGKTVFDGRKVLNKKSGIDYEGVCW